MSPRFQAAIRRVLRWEGGLSDNPNDPGGRTNYGISLRWLEHNGIDVDGDGQVSAKDVDALTPEKASVLYRRYFWSPELDLLASDDVAIYVFDMNVNMGQDRAARIAQEAAGVGVDGKLGPKSVAAMNSLDQAALLAKMRELRASFYRNLAARKPALAVFLRGWLKRAAS
jgi:lysozyme family protein